MALSLTNYVDTYKAELTCTIELIDTESVARAVEWLKQARANRRNIFVCGNGGSASTASHFACDIVKGGSYQREQRFKIMALTDSLPTLTAYSNDVGYDCVFAEQLKNFAAKGDVVVCISGSGNSPNVIAAMEYANSIGCRTIALTGRDGGKLGALAQLHISVPVWHMGRIEDAHMTICHIIAYHFMENDAPVDFVACESSSEALT
jgi:D-sedoheptulose 7-phosphate isomerase